jgi:PucR C-terminal helix-turn-helix domain/GGDEF-like domain
MSMDASPPVRANRPAGAPRNANSTLRELHVHVVNAVIAGEGLTRVAELTATAANGPVVIVAPQLGGPWMGPRDHPVQGGLAALELAVIDHLSDPNSALPSGLAWEVPITGTGIQGVVALLRTDRPLRPAALECLHVAALAALTESALTEARYSGEYGMSGSLLKDLRSRNDLDRDEIVRRGALLGCSLSRGAVAICAAVSNERSGQVLATIASECPLALAAYDSTTNPGDDRRRLYALVPGASGAHDEVTDLAEATLALARRLGVRIGRHGTVGLSSYCTDPAGLRGAVQEAELMLDLLLQSGAPLAGEIGNNGTYRLLFGVLSSRPEELRLLYRDTVAPLVGYDDQYHTELLMTLENYLSQNCNMNATASTMFAHRHTIAYRLDRIRELTGLDPGRSEDRELLGLGLKAYQLVRLQLPH